MKRYAIAVFAFLFVLLAGCVTATWYHPQRDQARMEQDLRECEYEGARAAAGIREGIGAGFTRDDISDRCMELRGYERKVRQ